ncbi:sialate O-acetylesterase [Chitinophaga defluvii]|uniref:Sialate O-acetylesterase n=1 Tax=Chitinophaga defluvii TaxID=3163343 RepID=A0ABV2TBM1_9BACT
MQKLFVTLVLLACTGYLQAKVVLPSTFTNNMVLQQKSKVPLSGTATADHPVKVTTSWNNKTYKATAGADGRWSLQISTPSYGGPYSITFDDGETLTLENILIGEVWICSGQSNMEMNVNGSNGGWGQVYGYEEEVATADYPQIRHLMVKHTTSATPVAEAAIREGGWEICSPQTVSNFSAVAYFFARNLYKKNGVPIGLIHTSWGGTIAEAWVSGGALKTMPDFKATVEKNEAAGAEAFKDNNPNRATALYNAMIYPFITFPVRGAIWYQGESNAGRAYQYRTLFPLLIKDWREKWKNPKMPFFFVQLASFRDQKENPDESDWAELREAQAMTLSLPNTGMAVAIDIGDAKDIHPKNKQDVGNRLALNARAKVYGEKVVFAGPVYQGQKVEGGKIRLTFKSPDGLVAKDGGALKGFSIAGADKKFHWATAEIQGNDIIVSCPEVTAPVAVRYAWADNPANNLVNKTGLPAPPFRTDEWAGITINNK